ncbi:hypothetical protein [Natrarchaeobaculum sulfurireducens]|uniref:Uncharacterized protein n=1 Tax=Natrarchaeobaculum sulfurireducens TaxID=2044521 RepID=A0A346P9G1_9EURY|nr:hypothetical protein [Natrarchaeobaculum sulfurireducens]AXR76156.1 hypothetical protein AArc1_4039 [Natrarchaeobaculum sulfurireducens]
MSDDRNLNRRKVLRNAAAAGSASLIGMASSVGATPEEASFDFDRLMESDRIVKLKEEIPDLEFHLEDARAIGGEEGIVAIPANHGTALTRPPGQTDAASFYFDEWVRGVDSDWVEGTQARLRVTDDETVLIRTATDEESEAFLSSIDTDELDHENTNVAVQPDTGEVTITHVDSEDRRYDRIQAAPAQDAGAQIATEGNGLTAAKSGLEVTDRDTEHFSGGSGEFGTQSSCDQDDVVFCVIEAVSCLPCAAATATGPLLAVCILFVCLGFPAVPIATILADIGCTNVAGCTASAAADIMSDLADDLGDQVPV